MAAFTVIGLVDQDTDHLLIATVLDGTHDPVDQCTTPGFGRRAFDVDAEGPKQAEKYACWLHQHGFLPE